MAYGSNQTLYGLRSELNIQLIQCDIMLVIVRAENNHHYSSWGDSIGSHSDSVALSGMAILLVMTLCSCSRCVYRRYFFRAVDFVVLRVLVLAFGDIKFGYRAHHCNILEHGADLCTLAAFLCHQFCSCIA